MQEEDNARTVDRRRVLRRAGTLAAGVAGAGVASAVVATPAQAADGDPVLAGQTSTGGSDATPTVRLENPSTSGAALSVGPKYPSTAAPAGSVYVDEWGDVSMIGDLGTGKYVTYAYSPTWATMTVPITPIRWLDTRPNTRNITHVVAGSATWDSSLRVVPRNSTTTPDLILDLSALFTQGYGAVQANLTVAGPAASGWASLWDSGNFPGTSSINYNTPIPMGLANFTQTLIGPDLRIRLKTSQAAHFFLDIVGFVVADPFAQLTSTATGMSASTLSKGTGTQKRRPPAR